MSWEAIDAALSVECTAIEKLVLLVLAIHTDDDGMAYPSIDTLARETRASRTTIFKAIAGLQSSGTIEAVKREGKPKSYRLLAPRRGSSESATRTPESATRTPESATRTPESATRTPATQNAPPVESLLAGASTRVEKPNDYNIEAAFSLEEGKGSLRGKPVPCQEPPAEQPKTTLPPKPKKKHFPIDPNWEPDVYTWEYGQALGISDDRMSREFGLFINYYLLKSEECDDERYRASYAGWLILAQNWLLRRANELDAKGLLIPESKRPPFPQRKSEPRPGPTLFDFATESQKRRG